LIRRRAFTVLETLVAAGLGLLLLVLTFRFFVPALKISLRSQERTGMQQRCYLALQKIRADLSLTNAAAVSLATLTPPSILAIQPMELETMENRPTYQLRLVSYHVSPQKHLLRRVWQPPPTLGVTFEASRPHRLDATQLGQLAGLTSGWFETRRLSPDVEEFSLGSAVPPPNIANPVRVKIVLKSGDDRCQMEQTVFLRNSP
jgi:type II secretory pathway component PulJ